MSRCKVKPTGRPPLTREQRIARFNARHVTTDRGCWEFTGPRDKDGYGETPPLKGGNGCVRAHRVAWEIAFGPIPAGMQVCHHCDNPPCNEPTHLFLGTTQDNTRDRDLKGRGYRATQCPRGHAYTGWRRPSGQHVCEICEPQINKVKWDLRRARKRARELQTA